MQSAVYCMVCRAGAEGKGGAPQSPQEVGEHAQRLKEDAQDQVQDMVGAPGPSSLLAAPS